MCVSVCASSPLDEVLSFKLVSLSERASVSNESIEGGRGRSIGMTPPSRQASALDEAVRRLSRPSTSSARKHVDGSSAPDDVDDEASMDRYVADLLLQEARQPPSWRNDIDVPVRLVFGKDLSWRRSRG